MKKLLALTVAALMALTMAACDEKEDDDDDDSSKKDINISAIVGDDSSEDDSSADDSSEDDSSADDSSEDDSSSDDSTGGSDIDVTTSTGTIEDGVITVNELTMEVEDDWTILELEGVTYFVPGDYMSYGNNVNFIRQVSDPMFDSYTEEIFTAQYQAMYGDGIVVNSFERTTLNGTDAIIIDIDYSGLNITQVMLNNDDCSFVVTFTGTGGTFDNRSSYINSIRLN